MALRDVDKFNEIIEKINKLVSWYENTNLKNKKIRLFLTNQDSFMYKIPEDKIAHLLGLNVSNIQSLGMFNNTSSYKLLKEVLNDYYRLCDGIRKDNIKLDYIFSKHIHKKIDNFKKNISINLEDIAFVCKYDSKKAYEDGKIIVNCDYAVIKILEDGTILELDLVLSPDKKYVYPVSNKMYTDEFEAEEALKRLLENQEIAIVNSMILYNNDYDTPRKFFLKDEMLEKISIVKKYLKKYNCNINLINEVEFLHKNTKAKRKEKSVDYNIYETIIDCILNNRLIRTSRFYDLTNQQCELIDAINDKIILGGVKNDENQESYSKLRKNVENLREAKRKLIEENKELRDKNKEKDEELGKLRSANELKNNLIKNITTSFDEYNEKAKNI